MVPLRPLTNKCVHQEIGEENEELKFMEKENKRK
jgi:hypothetical protein